MRNAITSFEDLEKWLTGQKARVDLRLREVIARYPMRVNTYYLSLIEKIPTGNRAGGGIAGSGSAM